MEITPSSGSVLRGRQQLAPTPNDSPLTYRLIVCLLETEHRARAKKALEELPKRTRHSSKFRRLEAKLLQLTGDWHALKEVLRADLAETPGSPASALAYAAVLYRLGDVESLQAFLARDIELEDASISQELELSKFQVRYGNAEAAVTRMYGVFRHNPDSAEAAGCYLLTLIQAEKRFQIPAFSEVQLGVAVSLESAQRHYTVVLESYPNDTLPPAADVLRPNSPLANELLGRKMGDLVKHEGPLGVEELRISAIESQFAYANRKAHSKISSAIDAQGPLFSVRVIDDSGKVDVEFFKRQAKGRREYVQQLLRNYESSKLPMCVLSAMLKVDSVTLWLEWPHRDTPIYVCEGTYEERGEAGSALQQREHQFVVDLTTLVELARLDFIEPALRRLGRPLVPASVKEELLLTKQFATEQLAAGVMVENEGSVQFAEIPPEYHAKRKALLETIESAMNHVC